MPFSSGQTLALGAQSSASKGPVCLAAPANSESPEPSWLPQICLSQPECSVPISHSAESAEPRSGRCDSTAPLELLEGLPVASH